MNFKSYMYLFILLNIYMRKWKETEKIHGITPEMVANAPKLDDLIPKIKRLFAEADPAQMAARCNVIIVQKSHRTHVYSPDGQVYENTTGNAGMATAGSGDVLTGILLGMLASNRLHASVYEIVCKAVEIHGKTGDIATRNQSESSLIASDMVENLRYISTDISAY